MTNRFQRGSGCFTCDQCGKQTRNTGDNGPTGLCQACYDKCGMENAHADGAHAVPCPECHLCNASPKTIDVTPTWVGILPTLLALYENATPKGKAEALAELRRMAAIADQHVMLTTNL